MLLTLHQAAQQLHVSWHTLRRAISDGDLAVVKLGKTARGWRIDPDDLTRYIAANRKEEKEEGDGKCPSGNEARATLLMSASVIAELDELLAPTRKPKPSRLASVTPLRPQGEG